MLLYYYQGVVFFNSCLNKEYQGLVVNFLCSYPVVLIRVGPRGTKAHCVNFLQFIGISFILFLITQKQSDLQLLN